MMKFSNTRAIKVRFLLLTLTVFLSLILFLIGFIFSNSAVFFIGILFLLLSLSFFLVMNEYFKCFEYDSSGEVISIKKYYPMFMTAIDLTEFPKDKLADFEIVYMLYTPMLKLVVSSEKKSQVSLYFGLMGVRNIEVSKLEATLDTILNNKEIGYLSFNHNERNTRKISI